MHTCTRAFPKHAFPSQYSLKHTVCFYFRLMGFSNLNFQLMFLRVTGVQTGQKQSRPPLSPPSLATICAFCSHFLTRTTYCKNADYRNLRPNRFRALRFPYRPKATRKHLKRTDFASLCFHMLRRDVCFLLSGFGVTLHPRVCAQILHQKANK